MDCYFIELLEVTYTAIVVICCLASASMIKHCIRPVRVSFRKNQTSEAVKAEVT